MIPVRSEREPVHDLVDYPKYPVLPTYEIGLARNEWNIHEGLHNPKQIYREWVFVGQSCVSGRAGSVHLCIFSTVLAMTTSKWDLLEENEDKGEEEDLDGQ